MHHDQFHSRRHLWGRVLSPFTVLVFAAASVSGQDLDFNKDIRPILSDKCYFCHGPDSNTREADLRLDVRDAAADVIDSGELIDRISSDDPDALMPPPESKLSLTDDEKRTLRTWVTQGAAYKRHWAFELLPRTVSVPSVENERWCRQPLDRFVLARLENEGLSPNDEASPLRWLRRATLDLTGLPPTLQQIEEFQSRLAIDSGQAYQDAVQSLLDSTAFGEHMAVPWLDAARYADSYGYQSDKLNTQWPYRDWVISAFNQNLSYDKFLTWQLAGDLLDNPSRQQLVATAFNRIHRLNNEGGAVFEEWRIENVADRVHTFGTAVLGLTMECCRCHDHKYDPIPSRDYYALAAFFNSIDESGVYDRTQKVPCPSILLPTAQQAMALEKARAMLEIAESNERAALGKARERWNEWQPESDEPLKIPDLRLAMSFDREFDNSLKEHYHPSQSDRSWAPMVDLVEVEGSSLPRLAPSDSVDIDNTKKIPPRRALKLDGERGITAHGIPPFDRWLPMSVVVSMRETKRVPSRSLIAHHTRGTDCGYNGWDLTIKNGHLESRMARVWPGNAISVRTVKPIPHDVWHQVSATYDGSSKAKGLKLYLNGKPLETEIIRDELKKSCNVKVDHGGDFVVGQRFRARGLNGGLIDDVRIYDRALSETELQWLATGDLDGDDAKPSFEYYASAIDKQVRESRRGLTNARERFVMAEEAMDEIPIMREMSSPRTTHVLARGEYDAPRTDDTLVQRATLTALPLSIPDGTPRNRLGLAKWVTDPQHPLTARVAVNRFWGNFFSSPLVRTPENFGSQGDLPTHPKLLDWLARDFVSNGWDVKRLCREIVLSSTYRQDSSASVKKFKLDPNNRLLARGPAHRLAAEQIRDLALSASGLLNNTIGGPPVSPYQPGKDLWKESNSMSPPFKQSVGKALYRRSLYSVWKRTAPLPNMMAFDSTTREVCSVKRSRTNTPLQALVLLNDVQFIEASRVMAQQLIQSTTSVESGRPIEKAFLKLVGRKPDQLERNTLQKLFEDERAFYETNAKAANELLSLGEFELDSRANIAELAALTNVCQAILNLDATIWKR